MSWSFETDSEFQEQLNWIDTFTREEIEPLDLVFRGPGDPWDPDSPAAKAMAPLRAIVKEKRLWACHLGPELGGEGYGQVKLGLMNEILGRSRFGPSVLAARPPTPAMPRSWRTSARRCRRKNTCSHCWTAKLPPVTP